MRHKTVFVAIAVLAAGMVAAASFRTYITFNGGGGYVLWDANEAYLFINSSQKGYHWSYLEYPFEVLGEYFYVVPLPDDQLKAVTAIHITPSIVDIHVVDVADKSLGSGPDLYTPLEGNIYADYPALGGLCRWAGDHFEPATPDEKRRLDGTNHLIARDIDNQNGWSKRGFGPAPVDRKFIIKADDKFELSISNVAVNKSGYGAVSVDLLRSSRDPERIWHLDGNPRRLSKAEYAHVFERR